MLLSSEFGLHESLAKEFKDSTIQVHCVHPGHVGTNIVANSRFNEDDASRLVPILIETKWQKCSGQKGCIQAGRRNHSVWRQKKKRRIFVGLDAVLMDLAQRITPMHYEWLLPIINLPLYLMRNTRPLRDLPAEPDSNAS